mgnify:CR=1 FL=1
MFLLEPFDIHYAESREIKSYERYVLNFKPDVLKDVLSDAEVRYFFDNKLKRSTVHLSEKETQEILGYFEMAEECLRSEGMLSKKIKSSAILILLKKVTDYTARETSAFRNEKFSLPVMNAIDFISRKYKENITLEEIAESANVSKYYFWRLFRKVTGATVFEYLDNIRIVRVHDLLLNTDMTIEEIAGETGFAASANLTRKFRKVYGMPPGEFRKANG